MDPLDHNSQVNYQNNLYKNWFHDPSVSNQQAYEERMPEQHRQAHEQEQIWKS